MLLFIIQNIVYNEVVAPPQYVDQFSFPVINSVETLLVAMTMLYSPRHIVVTWEQTVTLLQANSRTLR